MSLLWPTAAQACMPGTPVGRLSRPSPDMPAAIAPEVTIRYSFLLRSNWSTIPRSRLASIWPPGAIRLVPTLMTTLMQSKLSWSLSWSIEMVSHLTLEEDFPRCFFHYRSCSGLGEPGGEGQYTYPAIKMAFWQDEKNCHLLIPMPASNATSRFSDRVENYVRYRPGYPLEVRQALRDECGLALSHVIADIASGTGIWTRMLLENGNPVFGVEPNTEMRAAGERLLAAFPKFTSVAGTAEATTLPDHIVYFVTAAQGAHWFDRGRARHE